jgi:hypothetical protein
VLGEGRTSKGSLSVESVAKFVAVETRKLPREFQRIFLEDLLEAGKNRIRVLSHAAQKQ